MSCIINFTQKFLTDTDKELDDYIDKSEKAK
jgi:hypothetical protein